MSDSPKGDDTPLEGTKTEMNVSVELHVHATDNHHSDVMGDIGNPPRGNFTQISGSSVEEKAKDSSSATNLHHSPKLSIVVDDMESDDENPHDPPPAPTQQQQPNDDGEDSVESESTNASTMEHSPAPVKRSMVLSGREHEETDDFLLSTMLAIRTAVWYPSFFSFVILDEYI